MKVAVAHLSITANVRENGSAIRVLMRQATAADCRLVQFPEGALSGYCKQQITDWQQIDWVAARTELSKIAKLAQELHIWVVVGSAHQLTSPHLPHNSLYIISDHGQLIGRYDKRFLSHGEMQGWYTPGNKPVTFVVDGITIGLALCIEVQFYEVFNEYRRRGADVVLVSAYAGESSNFGLLAQAHAALNNMWIGLSTPLNIISNDPPLASQLFGPNGHIQATYPADKPGLAIATIAPGDPAWDTSLNRARPWRERAREGSIYRERYVADPRSEDVNSF